MPGSKLCDQPIPLGNPKHLYRWHFVRLEADLQYRPLIRSGLVTTVVRVRFAEYSSDSIVKRMDATLPVAQAFQDVCPVRRPYRFGHRCSCYMITHRLLLIDR
jgi:hypothetical protein